MDCPNCGLVNPETARWCDCGYDFMAEMVRAPLRPDARSITKEFETEAEGQRSFIRWYFAVLKKYGVFSGRARRKEFWYFWLVNLLICIALAVADGVTRARNPRALGGLLGALYILGVVIPMWAVAVRRLHDTNRSGWWALIEFVPLIGVIVLLVFCAQRGQRGDNQYGPDPRADTELAGRGQAAVARWPNISGPSGHGTAVETQRLASSAGKALAATATPAGPIGAQGSARAQGAVGQRVQTAQPEPLARFGTGPGASNAENGRSSAKADSQVPTGVSGYHGRMLDLPGTGGTSGPGPEPRAGDPLAPEKPTPPKATDGTGAAEARELLDPQRAPVPRQGWRNPAGTAVVVLASVICLTLGLTVWPTIYRHDRAKGLPIRTNRITGVTQVFTTSYGWSTVKDVSSAREIDSSVVALGLTGTAQWTGDDVDITLHNSTAFNITEITVEITVKDGAGNVLTDEKFDATPDGLRGALFLAPNSTGDFVIYTGDFNGSTWNFAVVDAKGVKA